MKKPALDLVLLFVENPQKSKHFYEKIFKIQAIESSPTFVMFKLTNGVMLGLWSKYTAEPRVEGGKSVSEICFPTENPEVLYKEWGEKEVTVLQKPTKMDFGITFVIADPDGHRIRAYKFIEEEVK